MSADRTKVMQEALQAAVMRMNSNGNGASGSDSAMPVDPLGLLMTVLPKLLQNNEEERDDLSEKIEALQKQDILMLRKQIHRVMKLQEQMLGELRDLQKQQSAVGEAVLHLAEQMARIEIIDELSDEADNYGRGAPPASSDPPRRAAPSDQRMRNKPAKR